MARSAFKCLYDAADPGDVNERALSKRLAAELEIPATSAKVTALSDESASIEAQPRDTGPTSKKAAVVVGLAAAASS